MITMSLCHVSGMRRRVALVLISCWSTVNRKAPFAFVRWTHALRAGDASVNAARSPDIDRHSPFLLPVYFDSSNHLHRDISFHPEHPARISACVKAIDQVYGSCHNNQLDDQQILVDLVDVAATSDIDAVAESPGMEGVLSARSDPIRTDELNHARDMLLQTHSNDLVTNLEDRSRKSQQRRIEEGKPPLGHMGCIDADTYLTTESFEVCLRATAAWIRAVDHSIGVANVLNLKEKTTGDALVSAAAAMALTRPPGHHATFSSSNGFCLFNFAVAAAMHVLQYHPSWKISILDWDVHYGQGKRLTNVHSFARYLFKFEFCANLSWSSEPFLSSRADDLFVLLAQAWPTL
jgi:Histone deacetylase domain